MAYFAALAAGLIIDGATDPPAILCLLVFYALTHIFT
jgi:hypothetical protein